MKPKPIQYDLFGEPVTAFGRQLARRLNRWRKPNPNWRPRRGNFASVETACSVVRGVLIQRLDDAFYKVIQPELTKRLKDLITAVLNGAEDGTKRSMDAFVTSAFQGIQLALFPEEFEDDQDTLSAIAGLIPRGGEGLERLGERRMLEFAKKIVG